MYCETGSTECLHGSGSTEAPRADSYAQGRSTEGAYRFFVGFMGASSGICVTVKLIEKKHDQ